ncbi:carboxypeptidase regulatory-like domain-containing protein [Acinetobacter sp. 228]|uniref:carboxypeptidase regulatory-like domain-containing protein n=1 Tax=Acinetobacter sp. 228 TaxID=3114700 RepID=UPI003A878967
MKINLLSNEMVFLKPRSAPPAFFIMGEVKTNSASTAGVLVRLFSRADASLMGQTLTKSDGSYKFTVADTKEKFIVAHHPQRLFNAVIQDNVVPK